MPAHETPADEVCQSPDETRAEGEKDRRHQPRLSQATRPSSGACRSSHPAGGSHVAACVQHERARPHPALRVAGGSRRGGRPIAAWVDTASRRVRFLEVRLRAWWSSSSRGKRIAACNASFRPGR
jgi:hypothetical protein